MTVVWKPCPDFEDVYAVSNFGEVKRVIPGAGRAKVGGILRPGKNPKGYLAVNLCRSGKTKTGQVHVLVCRAFHGDKPTAIHQAAHRDDDKSNNSVENLYWATPMENHADRRRNGRILTGSRIGKAKLSELDVVVIRQMKRGGATNKAVGRKFGVAPHTISAVMTGRTWSQVA